MSASPTSLNTAAKTGLLVQVVGKIDERRENDGKLYTRVKTPAPDEYSSPQTVEVRSVEPLGMVGEKVNIECVLGGYNSSNKGVTYNNLTLTSLKDREHFR